MHLKRQLFRPGRRIEQIGKLSAHPFFSRRKRGALSITPGVPIAARPLLARAAENVGALFSIAISSVLTIAVVALVIAFVKEMRHEAVYLDPIDVPRELAERGYTPAVLTERLHDEIRAIQTRANTIKPRQGIDTAAEQIDIQAPGGQLSMKSIVRYAHHLLDLPEAHLSGEITREGSELQIVVRMRGRGSPSVGTPRSAPDVLPLLKLGAEEAVNLADPYVVASYLFDVEQADSGYPRTLAAIRHVLATQPPDDGAWAMNLWGNVLRQQKLDTEAADKFRRSYALDAQGPAVGNLVALLAETGRSDEARRLLDDASAKARSATAKIGVGWGYANLGHCDVALAQFRGALAKSVDNREALFGRGLCEWRLQRYSDALNTMARLERRYAVSTQGGRGFGAYAALLVDTGRVGDAEHLVDTLNEQAPQSFAALVGKVVVHIAHHRYAEAKRGAQAALAINPDNSFALTALGESDLGLGLADEAIEAFTVALRSPDNTARVLVGLARALAAKGRASEALAQLDQAAKIAPDFAPTYAVRGRLLRQAGRSSDGDADVARARALAHGQNLLPQSPLVELIAASDTPGT